MGKKRFLIAVDRKVRLLGGDESDVREFLSKSIESFDGIGDVRESLLWSSKTKGARTFPSVERAELAAFALCAAKPEYLGKPMILQVSRKGALLKVARRDLDPTLRNKGRWPNSTGREKS